MTILLSELHNDPRKYRIDGSFFRRAITLSAPYWTRRGAWISWLGVALSFAMTTAFSASGAYMSQLAADVTNALVARKEELYWSLFIWMSLLGLARFGAGLAQKLLESVLMQHWWRWLTTHMMDDYLARNTYYQVTLDDQIDNPDQRLQEEVEPLCQTVAGVPRQLFGALMDMGVQGFILATLSPVMFVAVILYAIFQTLLTLYIYRPTIKQNFDATVAEADLRYGLTHVRDNAENIAFYQGEANERQHLALRLGNVIRKQMRLVVYQIYLSIVMQGSGLIWTLMPILILVPLYFDGAIDYGVIGQATLAGSLLLGSLSLFTNFIPQLSEAVPKVIRLAEIHEKFVELDQDRNPDPDQPRIHLSAGPALCVKGLSLQTPGGEQQLIRDLDLQLAAGDRLVIVGRTGIGKSSLLRAMAGLWRRGEGRIELPDGERDCLFLPQRPYTFQGDLRSQLIYPLEQAGVSDAELQRLLQRVALEQLLDKHGGLDACQDWSRILSLGEQQRIAFARLLLLAPQLVFLDEATSALDLATEARLYALLQETGCGYLSIGHRPSLLDYHRLALRLEDEGRWQLLEAQGLQLSPNET